MKKEISIKVAKINGVTVSLNKRNEMIVRMTLDSLTGGCYIYFSLENPIEVQRLKYLMNYAGVSEFKDLEGKEIRYVTHCGYVLAFGHLHEDKFISWSCENGFVPEIVFCEDDLIVMRHPIKNPINKCEELTKKQIEAKLNLD